MPDFHLSSDDVDSLAAYLNRLPSAANAVPPFSAQTLTPFSRNKATLFIRDRFPCLGCHRLGDEGGRIGPDLSHAGERLQPAYLRYVIEAPQAAMPASAMPRHLMPSDRVTLLANYLSDSPVVGEPGRYLSLTDSPLHAPSRGAATEADLYRRHCSACHGDEGNGDGYNAAFLPVPPTRHADSAYMATRPDDTLFDGVHAGGYILNRSHRMPAFGQLLSSEQIRSIVSYMRELCECLGPSWSRDNVRGR
jgi:mono/diheme cytochrome c family protein